MSSLEARLLLVDRVEGSNGRLGPDDESTNVTTRGELEEVEGLDGAGLDTGDVLESPDDTLVLGVNDEGTPPLPVPPVPHLTLTGPDLPRVGNLGDVGVGSDSLEELDGSLGLLGGLDGRREDEGDLLDLLDPVASGEDKGGESRGSEGRSNGVSSLVLVHLDVPLPPGLGRGEHSTTSAHVTERGLAGSLGTTTANTGDTRNGTTGTPRLGRGLVTGILSNGVSLSTVLGDRLCYFSVVRDVARFAPSCVSSKNSLWTCWTTSSLMGAVKTAGRGREPEASPVADQTVTVGRAAILMFWSVGHLTDGRARNQVTLAIFPTAAPGIIPGVSTASCGGHRVSRSGGPHGGAVASAAARLRVMPCVSFRCYCTLTRILYPGQLSPNAQGRTIPASNTQTHSHATHPLGAQSTSLRLRFSTPTQRFSRSNTPRRRRAPALQGHQHGAQKTLRREATGACGSTYRGR